MWSAVWRDEVLAEASHLTVVSGRRYFPPRSVRWEFLRETGTRPGPPGMGPEVVFDVVVDESVAHAAAWSHPDPSPGLLNLKNLVTFGAEIDLVVVRRRSAARPRHWLPRVSSVVRHSHRGTRPS